MAVMVVVAAEELMQAVVEAMERIRSGSASVGRCSPSTRLWTPQNPISTNSSGRTTATQPKRRLAARVSITSAPTAPVVAL